MLLNRPPPYADESLSSWLYRLALDNYAKPASLLHHLRQTIAPAMPNLRQLQRIRDVTALTALARVAGVSAFTIYRCSLHRFAHIFALPQQLTQIQLDSSLPTPVFLAPKRVSSDLYSENFNWCPHCLEESRHIRLHWHIPLLSCCEKHGCWLFKCCPHCDNRVTEQSIVCGCCMDCGLHLVSIKSVLLEKNGTLHKQITTIMNWLYGRADDNSLQLPDAPVSMLICTLRGLRHSTQCAGDDWSYHVIPISLSAPPTLTIRTRRKLSIAEAGCLYATAFQGLMDWPNGLYKFLEAFRKRPAIKEASGLRREFGTLYISWFQRLWAHTEFNFLQQAFNDYLISHLPCYLVVESSRIRDYPNLLDRIDYLDLKRTAQYLGCCLEFTYTLIQDGHLTPRMLAGHRRCRWFARQELYELKQRWLDRVDVRQLQQLLGIDARPIRALISSGVLPRVPAEDCLRQREKTFVERRVLSDFLTRLQQVTQVQTDEHGSGITIKQLCARNIVPPLRYADIFTRVLAGNLLAFHSHPSLLPLNAYWFYLDDVTHLDTTLQDEQQWFTKQDAKARLGISWRCYYRLIETDYLRLTHIRGQRYCFLRSDFHTFCQQWILIGEMARTLCVHPNHLYALIRQQHDLKPVFDPKKMGYGCYIFDRRQFNRWCNALAHSAQRKQLAEDCTVFSKTVNEPLTH